MIILNFTKKTVISKNLKKAISFSDNLLGFLKSSNPRGWMFKTRFGIHTFFLKEAIDVIVLAPIKSGLDKDFKVVKLAEVLPNRIFFWNPKYFYVLELPKGTIKQTETQIGDILSLR